jgi:aspartyl-tRNA(Asn)/glutamyl-tRNA(Gln) amidotransferase subunit B
LGLPGALPVANKKAIEQTVMVGLALGCEIPLFSKFDRKNYFYPDLPKGYQISQYDLPFAVNGRLKFSANNEQHEVGITRVHLEEDTAKMVHTRDASLIDFNRSGVPLMEIVTEPDLKNPVATREFLKKLQQIIRYIGVSDCDMEKGTMRCEPNISMVKIVNEKRAKKLPDYKVEVKNLNSFRFVEKALVFEVERQTKLLVAGKKLRQETKGWDEVKQVTFSQRTKEEATDYRYFPEPDLPPIRWQKKEIEALKKLLPELPDQRRKRLVKQFNLLNQQAETLTVTIDRADYFEAAVKEAKKHKIGANDVANVIINKRLDPAKYQPSGLIKALVKKQKKPKLSAGSLQKIVRQVIKQNPKAVSDIKKGKTSAVEFLVGQVMRQTKGGTDPNEARKIILKALN